MTWRVPQKLKSAIGSLCLAAVLLVVIFWGASSGQKLAQAGAIVQAAGQAQKSLNYFYSDENRYPAATEFADQNTMLDYLTVFPLPEFSSAACPETFIYKRPTDSAYSLSFCLPAATNGFQQGWNTVSGNGSGG